MKLKGKEFYGSSSLFKTHQLLQSIAGRAIWFTEFNQIKRENLNIIELSLVRKKSYSI